MSNLRKAAEQALKALETGLAFSTHSLILKNLRAALAEPEQEPFCYHDGRNIVGKEYADHSDVFPLYTAPPQQQSEQVNFCPRCGKRAYQDTVHTCTPPNDTP